MSQRRAEELLALRAVEALPEADDLELAGLLDGMPELDDGGFERAAAACHLALLGPEEPLPEELQRRLERQAHRFRGKVLQMPDRNAVPAAPAARPAAARPWIGWLAAAAALLLALAGWWPRLTAPTDEIETPTVVERPAPDPQALELPWQATEDPAAGGAGGSVVWSSARQTGTMRISGLAANDSAVSQYQLWIFDRGRDERYPVDGGVFDIPAGVAEVRVPIDAKIEVGDPYLFAITVEQPGGVVVSERQRIVLLAQAEA